MENHTQHNASAQGTPPSESQQCNAMEDPNTQPQRRPEGAELPAATCSVWIVVGETGEYSDYSEWNVAGFTSEEIAERFKDLCQNEADKVNGKDYKIRNGFRHAYDSQFYCDYTGTLYRVEMVEVFDALPQNISEREPNTRFLCIPKKH